ncbi:MAG: hypothetical protein AUJ52_10285 [Elusimicrobia bacterium CG1_02_63_36]|nr:MAG: hypothetical protein AUJ52_10285 [Elusimicrobia bacterium CG1_02_63_36]
MSLDEDLDRGVPLKKGRVRPQRVAGLFGERIGVVVEADGLQIRGRDEFLAADARLFDVHRVRIAAHALPIGGRGAVAA